MPSNNKDDFNEIISLNVIIFHKFNIHPDHMCVVTSPGGRLNKKDGLTRCGDSHVKDKTS